MTMSFNLPLVVTVEIIIIKNKELATTFFRLIRFFANNFTTLFIRYRLSLEKTILFFTILYVHYSLMEIKVLDQW